MSSNFKLEEDTLLYIFHLNTHTSETEYCVHNIIPAPFRPINIARYTSQVCRSWRETVLGSPALWGNLVDATIADNRSLLWAEEVIRRTGGAYLSIYGAVGLTSQSREFFTSLLTSEWHRVRRFDVILLESDDVGVEVNYAVPWDKVFCQPAPNLEKFLFRNMMDISIRKQGPLFADFAPSLRRFHCTDIDFDYKTPWISQLLSLTLSQSLDSIELLSILCTTTRLESLVIENSGSHEAEWPIEWTTQINLPHLLRLEVATTITQSLLYLQHITAHPDCALILHTWTEGNAGFVNADQIKALADIVKPYTVRYFEIHRPAKLSLSPGYISFSLSAWTRTETVKYFGHPELSLAVGIEADMLSQHEHQELVNLPLNYMMSTVLSAPIGCITELVLSPAIQYLENDNFLKLLASLSSVQTLIMPYYGFRALNAIPLDSPPVFPLLNSLSFEADYGLPENFPMDLLLFVSRRKAAGIPVSALDIVTRSSFLQREFDWSFLDEIEGLRVAWKRDQKELEFYVCGSGEKDGLNWRPYTSGF